MIHVHVLKLSELRGRDKELMDDADAIRREKALRFRKEDDRLRCLGVGLLMKEHLPGWSVDLLRTGKDGKPFIEGGPAFSISHGGDYVVLAWDDEAESLGVDVEPIQNMDYYRPIISAFATVEEEKAIASDPEKAAWVWTRKESLYKCIGEGFSDMLELPSVLEDRVELAGAIYCLCSRKKDSHMFSLAFCTT